MSSDEMYVTKRSGATEIVSFDKILHRIKTIGTEAGVKINYTSLAMKIIDQLYDKISTTKIDDLTAEQCAAMSSTHYDYGTIASHIVVSNHHKSTAADFREVVRTLFHAIDKNGNVSPLLSREIYDVTEEHADAINAAIDFRRDYLIDYFGFRTLEKSYLMRSNGVIIERPQHMWMRVAIGIHGADIDAVIETYHLMSQKYFTHATPTLFNAGTPRPQLSSCFLIAMEEDSIGGIYNTLKDCALISKWAGGIGMHIHNVRATGSQIRGTNGNSNGIVPMLRVFNNTAKYVDQGGGRRNGSFAIYLEPWHADIEMFLEMRKNHGDEELKARDLFYALWVPDLFMERVKADGTWTLMCPNECPGLADVYGQAFAELYTKYEKAGKGRATVKARELWFKVLDAQMETGTPYICYKDAANRKSNQQNVGTIKSSNLCVAPETIILTDKGHIEIQSLENKKVNVWNGEEYSEVEVKKTGENQKLIEVHTDDESILTCTPYHKFYVQTQYSRSKIIQTEAQNLKPGDKIIKCKYPIIDGTNTMLYPYTHGFFCGDGTYSKTTGHDPVKCEFKTIAGHSFCKRHLLYENENTKTKTYEDNVYCNGISYEKKPKIFLYGEKKELLEHMTYRTVSENSGRLSLELPMDIEEKFYVPLNHTLKDKMDWFSGYCDADGSIANNGTNQQLQICSVNKDFLLKVRLMLQTCGVNPKVRKNKEIGTSLLPDGRGGQRLFDTQELYRLLITSTDLRILVKAGFTPKRLIINTENIIQRSASQFIKIKEIVDNNRIDDTFCFTEPKRHMGVFNGIITGQCSEIMEYSDENETAVCNLASIALPTFVENGAFNYDKLADVAGVITRNLNRVIDINYYPTEKTRVSNMRHRPVGIGVQGLADVFLMMNVAYHSDEARELNRLIFETIYYGAVKASADLAVQLGPYPSFAGSPASKGQLQFDLWNVAPTPDRYDWDAIKSQIQATGMRNSLLLAPMPTASTSQILGFNECFEPFTSNIYSRRTMAGEFILTNKYLMRELIALGLWNTELKNNIIANQGSIQHIENLPEDMKQRYKTVWEIPMRHVIDMAAERGAFICQSQSLNLWIEDPTYNSLTSMHFYSWSKGLKTGIYYLRRRGKHRAQQFTIEPKNGGECELCSA
jgi:ribonucleoside-diphosphate reductase alpha chain